MPKPEKIAAVEEIKEKLSSAKIAILTEFQGLNVAEMTELRKLFREAGVGYKVYKNTLTRLAANQLGVSGIDEYLVGTTALAFGKDDLVASAKIVRDFGARHRNFRVKAGILDKRLIASDDVIALADIPPKEVLFAMIMGAMQSPISGLLSVIQAPARNFIYILKSLAEQKGKDAESDQPAEETGESDVEKGGESMAITKEEIMEALDVRLGHIIPDIESKKIKIQIYLNDVPEGYAWMSEKQELLNKMKNLLKSPDIEFVIEYLDRKSKARKIHTKIH